MQIAVYDVFVIAVVVCIGCGNKGYAVGRLHGANLFRDLKRLGPDVLGNIRLHILIARFHRLYRRCHLRKLIRRT